MNIENPVFVNIVNIVIGSVFWSSGIISLFTYERYVLLKSTQVIYFDTERIFIIHFILFYLYININLTNYYLADEYYSSYIFFIKSRVVSSETCCVIGSFDCLFNKLNVYTGNQSNVCYHLNRVYCFPIFHTA